MNKKIDIEISKRVISIINKYGLNQSFLSTLFDIKPSSVSDIINGKSPWRIKHLYRFSLYFSVTLDELVFGDKDYVKKYEIASRNEHIIQLEQIKKQNIDKPDMVKTTDKLIMNMRIENIRLTEELNNKSIKN